MRELWGPEWAAITDWRVWYRWPWNQAHFRRRMHRRRRHDLRRRHLLHRLQSLLFLGLVQKVGRRSIARNLKKLYVDVLKTNCMAILKYDFVGNRSMQVQKGFIYLHFGLDFTQFSPGQNLYVWRDLLPGPCLARPQFDVACNKFVSAWKIGKVHTHFNMNYPLSVSCRRWLCGKTMKFEKSLSLLLDKVTSIIQWQPSDWFEQTQFAI